MTKQRRELRNILLNPKHQLKYVFLAAGSALAMSGAFATVFYLYVRENYAILVDLSPMTDEAKAQLYMELRHILAMMSLSALGFVVLISLVTLVFSHRSAGPIHHFRNVFEEIRSGNLEARINLRPKDDFKEVADSFNSMMDQLAKERSLGHENKDRA